MNLSRKEFILIDDNRQFFMGVWLKNQLGLVLDLFGDVDYIFSIHYAKYCILCVAFLYILTFFNN